jgi:hypothetical protein
VIVDGQCYIVILPGVELPNEVPSSLEYYSFRDDEWVSKHGNKVLTIYDTYRYPVTEAEYRAHHWCIAHGVSVPEDYKVVGFCHASDTDSWLAVDGEVVKHCCSVNLVPILRKKACEHLIYKATFIGDKFICEECQDCGMVRTLGDWEQCQ